MHETPECMLKYIEPRRANRHINIYEVSQVSRSRESDFTL